MSERRECFTVSDEPGLEIVLLFFRTFVTGGTPAGLEGQELAWAEVAELRRFETPPADAGLIDLLVDGVVRPEPR